MKNTMKKLLALLLALVLTLALAACGQKEENKTDDQTNDPAITDQDNAADEKVTLPVADGAVIGQGAVAFTVEVQGADGKTVTFTVNTDEETVGAALLKLGVIAGTTPSTACMSRPSTARLPTTTPMALTGASTSTASTP